MMYERFKNRTVAKKSGKVTKPKAMRPQPIRRIAAEETFVEDETYMDDGFDSYQIKRVSTIEDARIPVPHLTWCDENRETILMKVEPHVMQYMMAKDLVSVREFVRYSHLRKKKEEYWAKIINGTDFELLKYNHTYYSVKSWQRVIEAVCGEDFDQYASNF
jgi:hypothetical protein